MRPLLGFDDIFRPGFELSTAGLCATSPPIVKVEIVLIHSFEQTFSKQKKLESPQLASLLFWSYFISLMTRRNCSWAAAASMLGNLGNKTISPKIVPNKKCPNTAKLKFVQTLSVYPTYYLCINYSLFLLLVELKLKTFALSIAKRK